MADPIATPDEYIQRQPIERQAALRALRHVILDNLPQGFAEVMQYGMIGYVVPHGIHPEGYRANPKEPLPFMGLANQKGHIALYHLGMYADEPLLRWFVESYKSLGIGKPDMGKSCIRFKRMDGIPFGLIGDLCSKMTVETYLGIYKESLRGRKS